MSKSFQKFQKLEENRRLEEKNLKENQPKIISEALTYNELLAATSDYWPRRFDTVKDVRATEPEVIVLEDGDVDITFRYRSYPSTEGKAHWGRIVVFPDYKWGQKFKQKLTQWWKTIKDRVSRLIGRRVPPNIIKPADLRKMRCKVSCGCKDFKYRMEVANSSHGASDVHFSNGRDPDITNPSKNPGLCKHLLGCFLYLSNRSTINVKNAPSEPVEESKERFKQLRS